MGKLLSAQCSGLGVERWTLKSFEEVRCMHWRCVKCGFTVHYMTGYAVASADLHT